MTYIRDQEFKRGNMAMTIVNYLRERIQHFPHTKYFRSRDYVIKPGGGVFGKAVLLV